MTAALEGGEWSAARPGRTLPPGKTWYPFYRMLGGNSMFRYIYILQDLWLFLYLMVPYVDQLNINKTINY